MSFIRMVDMSNDSHLFRTRAELTGAGWQSRGNLFERDDEQFLPLYEGKMVQAYDHRAASVIYKPENTNRANQPVDTTLREYEDPAYLPSPLSWVSNIQVENRLHGIWSRKWILGFKDITSATNERTVIASLLPRVAVGHTFPLIIISDDSAENAARLLANLNAIVFDFVARQKVGGNHLTYGYLKQLPVLPPETYDALCPWSLGETLCTWIAPRVLELAYTAWDLAPFARDMGYDGPPFAWDVERRFRLRCELDAAFFYLYGVARDDVAYVMDTFSGSSGEGGIRGKDMKQYGEYRTKRVVLEQYDILSTGDVHQSSTLDADVVTVPRK